MSAPILTQYTACQHEQVFSDSLYYRALTPRLMNTIGLGKILRAVRLVQDMTDNWCFTLEQRLLNSFHT